MSILKDRIIRLLGLILLQMKTFRGLLATNLPGLLLMLDPT